MAQEKTERKGAENTQRASDLTTAERLIEFIQKNRKFIFGGFIVIIVVLVGSIVGLTVRDRMVTNAFMQLDGFTQRHQTLMPYAGVTQTFRQGEIDELLEELAVFAARNSGSAAARAFIMSADIYYAQGMWPEAEQAWSAAANAARQPHLSPISLFNAAVAAEYDGDLDLAMALHTRVVQEHEQVFFLAIRSQFSLGRLYEAQGDTEAALGAWRGLVSRWPFDQFYANIAQSRIIVLSD